MPYRSMPGRPGRRLTRATGTWGQTILVTGAAHAGPLTPAAYGRQCEKKAIEELRKEGWTVTQSHLSRGAADLVAIRATAGGSATRLIQVKGTTAFRGSSFNKGLAEILEAPPVPERCVYGYVYGRGHVITITADPLGALTVTGQTPYAAAVRDALARRREAPNKPARKRKNARS